jgi:chemotaxis receptor (MCP) glutamine deamidase CheD
MVGVPKPLERQETVIHIGGVHATRGPSLLKTVLGSCIAVCLADPVARIGGMNHFMLPAPGDGSGEHWEAARYGIHAMDLLIGAMLKAGADRRRLQAKLFGGASLAGMSNGNGGVGQRNVQFIEEFVQVEELVVVSRDLGGHLPRQIRFYTDSGKVQVKRLGLHTLRLTRVEEQEHLRRMRRHGPQYGEITLFE